MFADLGPGLPCKRPVILHVIWAVVPGGTRGASIHCSTYTESENSSKSQPRAQPPRGTHNKPPKPAGSKRIHPKPPQEACHNGKQAQPVQDKSNSPDSNIAASSHVVEEDLQALVYHVTVDRPRCARQFHHSQPAVTPNSQIICKWSPRLLSVTR